MTDRSDEEASDEPVEPSSGLLAEMLESPIGTLSLLASIVLGAVLCYSFVDAGLSDLRRLAGGALAGGGCWLCVYVGRAIG